MPTKEVLDSRGLNLDPTCELCREGLKSILHTLRDCRVAKSMWKDLGFKEDNQDFFGLNLEAWLEKYCRTSNMFQDPVCHGKSYFHKQSRPFGCI